MSDVSPSVSDAAAAARRARRRLIHRLRSHVAVLAVAIFLVAGAGLSVQLASGNDPGLNDTATTPITQSADPAAASDDDATFANDAGSTSATTQSDGQAAGAGGDTSAGNAGAVTTRQS